MSVNKVIILGNLGNDPDGKYLPNGKAVSTLSVATTKKWKGDDGKLQEQTEWHRIVLFGRQAEIATEFLTKGSKVYIEGSLHTNKWTDKNGVDRYTTEIRASDIQLLDRPQIDQKSQNNKKPASGGDDDYQQQPDRISFDDDIPF